MRKLSLCVSPMMMKSWMATVTSHSSVYTVLVVALGLLFPSIPLTKALKLNGTTTTSTTTAASIWSVDVENYTATSSPIFEDAAPKTTIASFLQPDVSETTFIPQTLSQGDELTTTQDNASASSLAKRHSSIHVSESSSHDNNASPRFNVKQSSPFSTRESDPHSQHSPSNRETRPQKNGIGSATANTNTAEDEGDQSLSLSSTTEQNDDGNRNTLSSTTDHNDSNDSGGSSTFANSLGTDDDGGSLSLDKDESDSSGDDSGATPRGRGGGGSGIVEGDVIYPPGEGEQIDSDELADATTASLVRPGPTLDPNSFAIQLSTKLNRTSTNRNANRLGIRGLNSKSDLNAITSPTNASTTTTPTIAKNNTISRLRLNRRHNYTDTVASSDSTTNRANVAIIPKDGGDSANVTIPDNISDSNTFSTRFDLNGTSFSSRSNLNYAQQLNIHPQSHQQYHRARPTSPVINYNTNHNNNLHNRIIKRKKIPLGGRNETGTGGSSLSSIYGNSILSSTLSSISGEEEVADNVEAPARTTTTAPTSVRTYSLPSSGTGFEDATTESNSLLNASQQEHGSSGEEQHEQEEQGSPPSTSGGSNGDGNIGHNLTIPVISSEVYNNPSSNASSTLPSSSRAILGFGGVDAAADAAAHGKVKRPKPIIIRDHEDALFINNLSENNNAGAAPSENITGQVGNNDTSEETPVSSIGAGEEEINKPVGNNALPTPPFKVRKIKLNGRRASSSRPLLDYETTASSPLSLPPTLEAAPEESISSTRSGLVKAASGPTDYMQIREIIRPSTSHDLLHQPPIYSSRRVLKEEFGVTHHSYDDDHEDVDGLEGTTEFYSENSTPYPIPVGVRSLPEREESVDNEDLVGSDHGKNVGGSHSRSASGNAGANNANDEDDSKYRDYYSEIRSSAVDHGSGNRGHNLHIRSDSHQQHQQGAEIGSISPVTVTVTHTIVETTATYSHAAHTTPIPHNDYNNPYSYRYNHDHEMAKRGNNPNLHPTPALPSSILAGSTQSTFASGQGPEVISHTVENVQSITSSYGVNNLGSETTTHSGEDNVSDKSHNGEHEHKDEMTPVMPQPVEPTPAISTIDMKSVYFTHVEQPHYTSSSYEFTSSTMYSYMYPDHDHLHHHDDDDEEPHHPDGQGEEQQSSSPQPELEHNPEVSDKRSTIVSDDQYLTPTPTTPPFWGDLGNLTKSSSSQFPVALDKENGGELSTSSIDVDIYTPQPGVYPNSKVEQAATTIMPATTGSSSTTVKNGHTGNQVPGSMEDNEISEEELRKQQGRTTIKPPPPSDMSNDKGKTKIDDNAKVPQGGIHDHDTGKGPTFTTMINNVSSTSRDDGTKTPFGIGESFGIGSVHVPIMVQMVLDVAQPVFCKHLTGFKEMIVTVYETQKNIHLEPDQIVIYTEPSCASKKNGNTEDHGHHPFGTTAIAEPLTGTISPISKGTYPLTSPPTPPTTPRDGGHQDEDRKKSEPQKDPGSGSKNITNLTAQSAALTNLNKNQSELSNNKSTASSSAQGESAHDHQQKSLIRSRRSTKLAAGAGSTTKNSNMSGTSEDSKSLVINSTKSSDNSTEFSVFFYVNNKSGSYDQDLTSAFVKLWNESSSLLSNHSHSDNDNHGSGDNHVGGGGQHESSDSNYTNEEFIKKVKKVGMITASHLISTQDSSDENSGIIVAITVASIVAVCLFVLGVGLLVMRHRQAQTKFAKRCTPVTLDDYSLDNISVYNSFRRKQRLRGSKRSYTNAAFDDPNAPSKPLNATQLAAVLTDVPALENEFRAIPNITATLDDIPSGAETMNRYANVIPMPDSRVLLTFQEDTPNSDYINANYARGETGEQKRYIITQGPLEETIVDFWRMVWEQQIRVIYMLTDFAEGGIAKCAEYYPRSETIDCSQLHGDFQITLEKRDISDHCITSYLVIKDMERNLRRDVVHFWYHSWPEKGVPASPKMTIDFLNRSRKFTKEPIPILVHCSPGTGRSGAIVACDIAMKEYDAKNKIDIPQIVMKLRQDRAGAVQTKEQYVHIYEVLHSYVSRLGGANLESI